MVQSGVEKKDRFLHARHSRNWLPAPATGAQRDTSRQNVLVGRRESGTFSEAGEAVRTMHSLASGGHQGINQNAGRAGAAHLVHSVAGASVRWVRCDRR